MKNNLLRIFSAFFLLLLLNTSQTLIAQNQGQAAILREILEEKLRFPISNGSWDYDHIRSSYEKAQGTQVSDETAVNGTGSGNADEGEPFIAINPADSNNIILSYMETGTNGLDFPIYYTLDGGATWTRSSFSPASFFTQDKPGFQAAGGGDPVFAYDANGKLYFSWIYLSFDPNDFTQLPMFMYWAWSDDKGQTWNTRPGDEHFIGQGALSFTGNGVGTFGDGVYDRQWMDCNRFTGANANDLYVATLFIPKTGATVSGNGIILKMKKAGEDTFRRVQTPVSVSNSVQFSNVGVAPSGDVFVTFATLPLSGTTSTLYCARSTDGGVTFPTRNQIATLTYESGMTAPVQDRANPQGNFAVDPVNGSLHIVWNSFEGASNQILKGYYARSTDAGATWSTPLDLNTLSPAGTYHSYMPTVATANNGTVSISWYPLDSANDEGRYYAIESTDGGQTFGVAEPVSGAATRFRTFAGSQSFFGDYAKSIKAGCSTWSVWSDGRSGTPQLYIAETDHCTPFVGMDEMTPLTEAIQLQGLSPNPFRDRINLELQLQSGMEVSTTLLSTEGKAVWEKAWGKLPAGTHQLQLEGMNEIAAGMYLVRIETEAGFITRRVVRQ